MIHDNFWKRWLRRLLRRPPLSVHVQSMRTRDMIAGAPIKAGEVVYMKPDGKVYPARIVQRTWWQRLLRRKQKPLYTAPLGIAFSDAQEGESFSAGVSGQITVQKGRK